MSYQYLFISSPHKTLLFFSYYFIAVLVILPRDMINLKEFRNKQLLEGTYNDILGREQGAQKFRVLRISNLCHSILFLCILIILLQLKSSALENNMYIFVSVMTNIEENGAP